MKVTLLESALGDGAQVRIAGEGVSGFAPWRGGRQQASGELLDVELDARDEINWREVIVGPPPAGLVGKVNERALTIRGVAEGLDQYGVLTIEVVGGGFIMPDTAGEPPLGVVGREVSVTIPRIEVYPYGV